MTAETDITAINDGGANTAAEVRTALTSVLTRADLIDHAEDHATRHSDGGADEIDIINLAAAGTASYIPERDGAGGLQWIATPSGGASDPLTTKGDLFGFDTDAARIPVGTNNQVLTADSAEALGVKWADPSSVSSVFNVLDYGAVADSGTTDNSTAFQNAIDAAAAVNGKVYIPAASGWYEAHALDLDGAWGLTIEGDGEGSQIRNTGGSESVFRIGYTSTLSNATFRNFRVTTTVAGKAAFEIKGMYSCRFEMVMMNSYTPTSRNIMSQQTTGWAGIFDCTWADCSFSCDGVAQSVPLFDIVDVDSDRFNSNTIRGGRVTGSATATSVLFKFSSQHTNSYHYQNTIHGVNFEVPNAGAILIEGGNAWTLDTIGGYDISATMTDSFIKLAKHASGNENVGCHITNCTNITLQSRGSYYDIETTGDYHTIINSGGHNTSGKLDFNDDDVIVIGCGRSTLSGTVGATIINHGLGVLT